MAYDDSESLSSPGQIFDAPPMILPLYTGRMRSMSNSVYGTTKAGLVEYIMSTESLRNSWRCYIRNVAFSFWLLHTFVPWSRRRHPARAKSSKQAVWESLDQNSTYACQWPGTGHFTYSIKARVCESHGLGQQRRVWLPAEQSRDKVVVFIAPRCELTDHHAIKWKGLCISDTQPAPPQERTALHTKFRKPLCFPVKQNKQRSASKYHWRKPWKMQPPLWLYNKYGIHRASYSGNTDGEHLTLIAHHINNSPTRPVKWPLITVAFATGWFRQRHCSSDQE